MVVFSQQMGRNQFRQKRLRRCDQSRRPRTDDKFKRLKNSNKPKKMSQKPNQQDALVRLALFESQADIDFMARLVWQVISCV